MKNTDMTVKSDSGAVLVMRLWKQNKPYYCHRNKKVDQRQAILFIR